jgi:hypothetical protein
MRCTLFWSPRGSPVWLATSETRREYVPIGSSKTSLFWKVSEVANHTGLLADTEILYLRSCNEKLCEVVSGFI